MAALPLSLLLALLLDLKTITMSSKGPTPSLVPAIAWHCLALLAFTYAFQKLDALASISGFDITTQFGSHYAYLTNWGLWISRLGMSLALLSDLLPQHQKIRTAKMAVCVAALPMETLISLLYWTILTINSDLLIPPKQTVDPNNPAQFITESIRLPLLTDLSLHAAPALFLLVDFLLFSPPFSHQIHPTFISATVTLAYCAWAEVCAHFNGHYPYPLLDVLSPPARGALYIGCAAVFVAVLELVQRLHSRLDKAWERSWSALDGQLGKGVTGKIDHKKHIG